jgi:hypothetical protein
MYSYPRNAEHKGEKWQTRIKIVAKSLVAVAPAVRAVVVKQAVAGMKAAKATAAVAVIKAAEKTASQVAKRNSNCNRLRVDECSLSTLGQTL